MDTKYTKYKEDKLCAYFYYNGHYTQQGKRVGKYCLVSYDERRAYVTRGAAKAVKLIMKNTSLSARKAKRLLDQATGPMVIIR